MALFLRRCEQVYLLISDREQMTGQSMNTSKVQLSEPRHRTGVRNMGEGLLTRTEIKTAASRKPTPAWVTVHRSWETRAHCTACRQLSRTVSILCQRLCWSEPFLGSSAGVCLSLLGNLASLSLLGSSVGLRLF